MYGMGDEGSRMGPIAHVSELNDAYTYVYIYIPVHGYKNARHGDAPHTLTHAYYIHVAVEN